MYFLRCSFILSTLLGNNKNCIAALEITGSQRSLTAGIRYMTGQKVYTMISMTNEFFLVSKMKFSFNLARFYTIQLTNLHYKIHSHTKFTLHNADQIWLPSISMRYITIMKLYNFFKKTKLTAREPLLY